MEPACSIDNGKAAAVQQTQLEVKLIAKAANDAKVEKEHHVKQGVMMRANLSCVNEENGKPLVRSLCTNMLILGLSC
jgi:hypothetical protein